MKVRRGKLRTRRADTLFRTAIEMQACSGAPRLSPPRASAELFGEPLSRRTAERLRDGIERAFPRARQANPRDVSKRWGLPAGTVSGFACVSAEEPANLATGVALLHCENLLVQAATAERRSHSCAR